MKWKSRVGFAFEVRLVFTQRFHVTDCLLSTYYVPLTVFQVLEKPTIRTDQVLSLMELTVLEGDGCQPQSRESGDTQTLQW